MTSLQIGLIVAGVVLVAVVFLYNWLQERRVRRRMDAAFAPRSPSTDVLLADAKGATARGGAKVEPTLREEAATGVGPLPESAPNRPAGDAEARPFEPPVDVVRRAVVDAAVEPLGEPLAAAASADADRRAEAVARGEGGPDAEIESIVTLQPVAPVGAGALAAGLHARLGKPLRWFGRRGANDSWQRLRSATRGEFTEIAACLLLADRTGAASAPLLEAFVRLAAEVATSLPAAYVAPSPRAEAERAEALDRICADLDVQIGVTLLKAGPETISGARLGGVAEAAGFRLGAGGRFEWVQEETGALLFTLQNYRSEPFTADSLRLMSTPGAVLLLDVPRVDDPASVFDKMKEVAKRMAQTLDAVLVDDNRRPLDDAALDAIRQQVQATAAALSAMRIEPGGARALALFGG